jgi:hypothetical protein
MAAQRIADNVNYWMRYRNPNHNNLTAQQAHAYFRKFEYNEPPLGELQGADPEWRSLPPGQPLERPQPRDQNNRHRQFLDKVMPQLMDDPAEAVFWEGTKFLGEGGAGMVGLWE